jgi:hypothetical protein
VNGERSVRISDGISDGIADGTGVGESTECGTLASVRGVGQKGATIATPTRWSTLARAAFNLGASLRTVDALLAYYSAMVHPKNLIGE